MNILNNGRFGMGAALSGTQRGLIAQAVSYILICLVSYIDSFAELTLTVTSEAVVAIVL